MLSRVGEHPSLTSRHRSRLSCQILSVSYRSLVSESQLDGPCHHLHASWSCRCDQIVAVESTPALRFPRQKFYQPIELFMALLRRGVLDTVDVYCTSSRAIAQCRMVDLVIHENDVARFIALRITTRHVFRFDTQLFRSSLSSFRRMR